MENKLEKIKNTLRDIGKIGIEINKFYEDKLPTITYQDALTVNSLARKLDEAIKIYEKLLVDYKKK